MAPTVLGMFKFAERQKEGDLGHSSLCGPTDAPCGQAVLSGGTPWPWRLSALVDWEEDADGGRIVDHLRTVA